MSKAQQGFTLKENVLSSDGVNRLNKKEKGLLEFYIDEYMLRGNISHLSEPYADILFILAKHGVVVSPRHQYGDVWVN